MYHDATLHGAIVHARLQPDQLERVAVLPRVGLAGEKRAEARAIALGIVSELHRTVGILFRGGAPAVGDELVKEDAQPIGVDHPEAALRGREGVVDHGEDAGMQEAVVLDAPVGGEGKLEEVAPGECGVALRAGARGAGSEREGEDDCERCREDA